MSDHKERAKSGNVFEVQSFTMKGPALLARALKMSLSIFAGRKEKLVKNAAFLFFMTHLYIENLLQRFTGSLYTHPR